MSKKRDLRRAHRLVLDAHALTNKHLATPFYDFVFEDFNALLFTLDLLAKEAERITPPKTDPPSPG